MTSAFLNFVDVINLQDHIVVTYFQLSINEHESIESFKERYCSTSNLATFVKPHKKLLVGLHTNHLKKHDNHPPPQPIRPHVSAYRLVSFRRVCAHSLWQSRGKNSSHIVTDLNAQQVDRMSEKKSPPPYSPSSAESPQKIVEQRTKFCTVCNGCGCSKTVSSKIPITVLTALWGFLTNVERAIILPTMWLYFTTYWSVDAAKKWYGWTMASFSLSVLLFTPVYGYAAHSGIQTKYLLIFANLIEVFGNLAYLVAQQPWVVLAGRFISGIGGSCDTPMYADMARTTSLKERTPYMTVTFVSKQIGIVFGPVCTLLMHKLKWAVGDFKLSVYNGPGLLMAALWAIHTSLVIFFYPIVEKPQRAGSYLGGSASKDSEKKKLIEHNEKKHGCCDCECEDLKPYITYPIISMYIMIFATYFCVMSLETVLPPVASNYFHWDEVNVSYVYLGASGLLIIMCFILHGLSKHIEDRTLALVGFVFLVCAYMWLMFTTMYISRISGELGIILVILGVATHVIGMPLALAVTESLYTKMVPANDLDRALSYLRCVSNLAFLLGPLEGGILVEYAYLVFLGNFLICALGLALLAARYKIFHPKTGYSDIDK